MYPEFQQWLDVRVSPERKALIMDAFECLAELLDLRVWDTAVNVMSLSERMDTVTCLADIDSELREYCIQAALQYGITLNVDRYDLESQPLVNKLLMTLLQVDAWEDGFTILNICESDETPEEILAALCQEISGVDAEELLPLLGSVEAEKIQILTELYRHKLNNSQPAPEWHTDVIKQALQYKDTVVAQWLLDEGVVGLACKHYVDRFVEQFIKDRSVEIHAKNWILMSLASGTSDKDQVYTECVSYFDVVYQNLEVQAKVSKQIKRELELLK